MYIYKPAIGSCAYALLIFTGVNLLCYWSVSGKVAFRGAAIVYDSYQ